MTATETHSGRREQIDGLRVIAMTGVLYVHFWNDRPTLESVRVSLFFIISGFLIGSILLSAKDARATINVANFYVRRSLRLIPALFLMLSVAALFNMDGIQKSMTWHVFQLSNLYFAITEGWKPWVAAHLWSLNIVEQFYLTAPVIIVFLSRRHILLAYSVILTASIVARTNYDELGLLPWSNIVIAFDPVAAGVILALVKDNSYVRAVLTNKFNTLGSIAIILSPLALGFEFGHSETYKFLCIYALSSIVLHAYIGFRGPTALLLANPATRFLSRISYATYVYHMALWWLVAERWPVLYHTGPETFLIMGAATIVVATISWHLIEKHFDALKVSFPVVRPAPLVAERD